jgi:uncharacterized protein (TIGR03435 family)
MAQRVLHRIQLLALISIACLGQADSHARFEVASIKPLPGGGPGPFSGGPGSNDPERVTYGGTRLDVLIQEAFHLEPYQISGPAWLKTEWYSLSAKLPANTTAEQYRQMMVNLLVERFGLAYHRVTKEFRGYEIVVAKGGPKLNPSAPLAAGERAMFRGSLDDAGRMHYVFAKTSMSLLTNRLSIMMRMKVPVLDHTGITGRFDFTLDVEQPPPDTVADVDDNSNNISEAMQAQLGLKLNPVKLPVDVLVVDHVERMPTEN